MPATLEQLAELVPQTLRDRSGEVFYSGRAAFETPAPLYILGLNPGGNAECQAAETVGADVDAALARREPRWSAYVDEQWGGRPAGTAKMQPRIQHLLRGLDFDPRLTPASNVVFVRTTDERELATEKADLLRACWPFHQAVIEGLGVRLILCLGATAGAWTRERVGANVPEDSFSETNLRRWTNLVHAAPDGLRVATLTHPGRAAWQAPEADPTPMVRAALDRAR